MSSTKPILIVEDVSISFGGLQALYQCSFSMEKGEIFSLIGPNGAGKTTIFNIINALYKPDGGRILFEDENLLSLKPHQVAKRGIARTFQNIELFNEMTVLENVLTGRHFYYRSGVMANFFATRRSKAEEDQNKDYTLDLLNFLKSGSLQGSESGRPFLWNSKASGTGSSDGAESKNFAAG